MSDSFPLRPPILETDRLTLRALSVDDAATIYDYASDPEVARYTLWPPHPSEAFTRNFLAKLTESTVLAWVIVFRADQRVVGMIFFHSFNQWHQRAELAFNLARSHWRRGVATEASHTALQFAFEKLTLNRVEATCMPGNSASRRVLIKLGMEHEGTLRRSHRRHDGFHDMELFGVTHRSNHTSL